MERHHQKYHNNKLAYHLKHSPFWQELLLPMLESAANEDVPPITTMDSAFVAAAKVAEKEQAAFFIGRINRMAAQFTKLPVTGSEAPIVVPE